MASSSPDTSAWPSLVKNRRLFGQTKGGDALAVLATRWTSPHDVGLIKSNDGPGLLCDVNTVFMNLNDVKDIIQP